MELLKEFISDLISVIVWPTVWILAAIGLFVMYAYVSYQLGYVDTTKCLPATIPPAAEDPCFTK